MSPSLQEDRLDGSRSKEAFRSSVEAELFEAMFEQVPLPLMIVDLAGRISLVNKGCQDFIGLEASELRDSSLPSIVKSGMFCASVRRSSFGWHKRKAWQF
jgi:PAS domain-containing protein